MIFEEILKPRELTNENVSVRLTVLYILKNSLSNKFYKKNLEKYLVQTIGDIKKIPEEQIKELFDLQPIIDFWYYTKLLGYKDDYKPKDKLIKQFISKKKIKNVNNPIQAIFMYCYIRALIVCDNKKYKHLKEHINFLKSKMKSNDEVYGYYLTHSIFYDVKFGKIKNRPIGSLKTLKKLDAYCQGKLEFNRRNVDLIGEIILCYNLLDTPNFPYYSKMLSYIKEADNVSDFHERGVLTAVLYQQMNLN